eukprot:1685347-Rhodomonas_salina.1
MVTGGATENTGSVSMLKAKTQNQTSTLSGKIENNDVSNTIPLNTGGTFSCVRHDVATMTTDNAFVGNRDNASKMRHDDRVASAKLM